jgi:1-acyl-sn-glycerol-3-phosphate acyltransferase
MTLWPRWLRRVVLGPLLVLATIMMLASLPLWAMAAAFVSRHVPGRWRPLRLMWFLMVWLVLESLVLVALFALWVGSGFGWKIRSDSFQAGHYRLMGWFLGRVVASALRTFGLTIEYDAVEPGYFDGLPVLVFARHAGPGDSLLLVEALLNRYHRRPRIVLKDTLQWDPVIDVALNRLPSRFIETRGRAGEAAIEAIGLLASTMGSKDALVIFPEGGNYTEGRWARAIDKLESGGLSHFAAKARLMEHVLPPKPGGVVAAITNAPTAGIALIGHSGTEDMDSIHDVWKGLKMDLTIATRVWRYRSEDVPLAREGLESWLYERWAEMNKWIAGEKSVGLGPETRPTTPDVVQNAERQTPNAKSRTQDVEHRTPQPEEPGA